MAAAPAGTPTAGAALALVPFEARALTDGAVANALSSALGVPVVIALLVGGVHPGNL